MAKKNNSKDKFYGQAIDYKNWNWALNNLPQEALDHFDESPPTPDEIMIGLHRLQESGFKITSGYDDYSKCWIMKATCGTQGFHNSGIAISARGNDFEDCAGLLIYKYFTVAQESLVDFVEKPRGVRG